jgi:methylated-DNA-[protein]-cysteine S-methyltransferase
MPAHFALFETPIGTCAIAWTEPGIAALQLPERTAAATRARITHRLPDATESGPPPEIRTIIDKIAALIAGDDIDLRDIPLDLTGIPAFDCRVYEIAREIPPGETMTYGAIATRLGDPHAARAVGQALGKNPVAIIVPCHRVLAAGGRIGGFSANGGVGTKRRLLAIESTHRPPPLFRSA